MMRLTDQAHALIANEFQAGETAIDATAGNGHDTRFLSQLAGQSGKVFAIDIQQQALDQAAVMLQNLEFHNVELICGNHCLLAELVPSEQRGQIGAIMFNLGYLPGGDHAQITQELSTLPAIEAALTLIRPGGIITILAYPGHPGGAAETSAVAALLSQLERSQFKTQLILPNTQSTEAPRLFVVTRLKPASAESSTL
ncbi:tRNA (mnm(5)s(2)U34)-methyltransferase [Gimesia sp.]|uniref:tRNA (mnm(5)s(2)U34)-methyltransferase n=1 Tax=Gimesia sp. TaxID=2024833 RepID=UPI003A8E130E